MESNFKKLVTALNVSPISTDVLQQIIQLLEQQSDKSFDSLFILQQWAWQLLSGNSSQWINEPYYKELLHSLASFNKKLIFHCDEMEGDTKAKLLFSATIDQIDNIFKQIEKSNDDNDPFIIIASLWFDNHSYFTHDNPHYNILPITDHINQYIVCNYVINERFKVYLTQLRQLHLEQGIFSAKMLFYMKTCLFSISSYVGMTVGSFPCTADEMLRHTGEHYLHIVHVHSPAVASWSKELLTCMTHLISSTATICWWDGLKRTQMKVLFPTEQILCDHIQDLIDIIAYQPFQQQIKVVRSNDETILMHGTLLLLLTIVQRLDINWFFRSNTKIQQTLLTIAEISLFDEVCLCAYGVLGEVVTDEQLKDLKIVQTISGFFFNMLEHAWHHPSKQYKHISIEHLLRGYGNLTKHDFIQQRTADMNKIPLLIEISEQYSMMYDILWALSFNHDIQQQLRSSSSFMSKLFHLEKECVNDQMCKVVYGILWNLEINHRDHPRSEINDGKTFDIMISYSHKDKILCKQIYDALTKSGYHVWIDFDQMHGNVMDAMAQAIERSHTIIICMSEEYRISNYCRAEAHYAFQRQRKIVPVLLQKHYKPDGWLLFLIGQLLYVDFIKYEFTRATDMLLKELKTTDFLEIDTPVVRLEQDIEDVPPTVSISSPSPIHSKHILEWSKTYVQVWLVEHNLIQMACLLSNCDGRSLVYLNKHIKHDEPKQVLRSLHEDSIRRTGQNLSLIELSCLQSLIDQEIRITRLTPTRTNDDSRYT